MDKPTLLNQLCALPPHLNQPGLLLTQKHDTNLFAWVKARGGRSAEELQIWRSVPEMQEKQQTAGIESAASPRRIGAGSFGPTNARQRWAGFLNTDLSYASEFRECYEILHQRDDELLQRLTAGGADHASVDALRASSPALAPIEQLGMLIGGDEVADRKLGKAERYFYLMARKVEMDQRARALPPTDMRRMAYLNADRFSSEICRMPSPDVILTSSEHREALCAFLALPSPAATTVLGQVIKTTRQDRTARVDLYGANISAVCGACLGDDRRLRRHNDFERKLVEVCQGAGVPAVHGYDATRHMIVDWLPEGGAKAAIKQLTSDNSAMKGIVPDFGLTLKVDDAVGRIKGPCRSHGEIKSYSSTSGYMVDSHKPGGGVAAREAKIAGEKAAAAAALDGKHYPLTAAPGPFALALAHYPPALGVVFGMFGELSKGGHDLVNMLGRRAGEAWASQTGLDAHAAASGIVNGLRKEIALTIAKANAQERLRGAEYVRTGRMPTWDEAEGISSFKSCSLFRAEAERRSMAPPRARPSRRGGG